MVKESLVNERESMVYRTSVVGWQQWLGLSVGHCRNEWMVRAECASECYASEWVAVEKGNEGDNLSLGILCFPWHSLFPMLNDSVKGPSIALTLQSA